MFPPRPYHYPYATSEAKMFIKKKTCVFRCNLQARFALTGYYSVGINLVLKL